MVPEMVPPTQLLQGPRDLLFVEAPAAVLVLAAEELLHAGPALLSHALHEAGNLLRLDLPVTIRVHTGERLLSRLVGAHLAFRALCRPRLLREVVVVEAMVPEGAVRAIEAMVPEMVPPTQLLQGPRDLLFVEAPAAVLVLAAEELLHAGPALLSHALHEAGNLLRLDLPV